MVYDNEKLNKIIELTSDPYTEESSLVDLIEDCSTSGSDGEELLDNVIKDLNKQSKKKAKKESFAELKKYEKLLANLENQKLNFKSKTLAVYRAYKDLREYLYIATTHMTKHAQFLIAKPLIEDVFEAIKYLSHYVNAIKPTTKETALERFLAYHETLVDKIEFCVEIKALAYKQASHLLSLIYALEPHIEAMRKSINKSEI